MNKTITINFNTTHQDFLSGNSLFENQVKQFNKLNPILIRFVFESIILNDFKIDKKILASPVKSNAKNSAEVVNYLKSLNKDESGNLYLTKYKYSLHLLNIFRNQFFLKKEIESYTTYINAKNLSDKFSSILPVQKNKNKVVKI